VPESLIEAAAQLFTQTDKRIYGVTVGQVVDNLDSTRGGRVQVSLPWIPEVEPWCRVAVLSAGDGRGTYFIPQVGDEVLVAFEQGDVNAPYVIGSLWNGSDKPPADLPSDSVNKRIIKTPNGHEVLLDDMEQSIAVTSSTGQKLTLDQKGIVLDAGKGAAKVTLSTSGTISIEASTKVELKAQSISVEGTNVDVKASAAGTVDGGGALTVKGGIVRIN
jgi:uncharacterized protein involved in type VI secretion and phage assembly